MGTWVLIVYMHSFVYRAPALAMQEFETQATCQAAGTKIWELTGREALWSCMKK